MDKIQIIEKLFYNIVTYSYLVLPLTLLVFKEKKGIALWLGVYGLIVCVLLNLFEHLPLSAQIIYLSLYTLLEYFFFTYLLSISIQSKVLKHVMLFFSVCFTLFQAMTYFLNSKIHRLDSVSVGIETILVMIYIFFFFYDHSKNNKAGYIYNHPTFWLSVGILLYLAGSFFFNILINFMSSAEYDNYWHYTYIAEILKNILFGYALVIISRNQKLNPLTHSKLPYLDMDMN